jgi:hypothetical protein
MKPFWGSFAEEKLLITSKAVCAYCANGYPLLKVVPKGDFLFDSYHALG